jgi:hypothetical protein
MEMELLAKEKNNEISRLNQLLQIQPKDQTATNEVRRLEEDLRGQKQRYDSLMNEFEKVKRETNDDQTRETFRERNKNNGEQMRMFEALIAHLREESVNQNRASMDLLNSMITKMDERKRVGGGEEETRMLEELFQLRNEVTSLKREREGEKLNPFKENANEY